MASKEHINPWPIGAFSQRPDAPSEPVWDPALGEGLRFPLGTPPTTFEIYPEAAAVRLRTRDAEVNLYRVASPQITEHGVVFQTTPGDAPSLALTVAPSGSFSLAYESPGLMAQTDVSVTPPAADVVAPSPPPAESEPRVTLRG